MYFRPKAITALLIILAILVLILYDERSHCSKPVVNTHAFEQDEDLEAVCAIAVLTTY